MVGGGVMGMMLVDTHCHLASRQFDQANRGVYVERALAAGVGGMITLGASMDDWACNVAWARQFPERVACALGIHPDDALEAPADWAERLEGIAAEIPLAAIGETGLDYFHTPPAGWDSERFHKRQQELLERHFELAARLGLNIVLHTRDRQGAQSLLDTMAIARPYAGRVRPVFHCFIGDCTQAKRIFDELDGMLSFTGICTFANARGVAETAVWCPPERMMLETDSPYLSPVPLRGKMNEPAHMCHTARFLADAKGMPVQELARVTTDNAVRFYRIGGLIAARSCEGAENL